MNLDFEEIKSILLEIKSDYINGLNSEKKASIYITERDIVSEIFNRLKLYCSNRNLSSHTEIKPVPSQSSEISDLKRLPRIDNVILQNKGEKTWKSDAINFQDKYKKGLIEARFSSVPIEYFHTAIEVKIQSNTSDAKKDIDKLRKIQDANNDCNCFFMLLNARGRINDHNSILEYAKKQNISIIDYTNHHKQDKISEISLESQKNKNKVVTENNSKSRRSRIIDLINQKSSDTEILKILDIEYPYGTFKTSNSTAIYGTKRDMGFI
ncbi:MAG: hypothetical protein IPO21_06300 [Bacteroidales bacterium]|nr:hypothetical protein [Bacteroidales bacterium]